MSGAIEKKPGALRALRAVISAFTGIGKGSRLQDDLATLRPWQVIVAGLICAALFVGIIVMVVRNIAT
ncbi:MAG: DUF2970 domain-containing protein [Burkholderiales bacterium]|jgi:hypothetical protein